MLQLTNKERVVIDRIEELIYNGELSTECQVQIIELCGVYLNLETISHCAKREGKTYNGIKKSKTIITLFGQKFVKQ